MSNSGSFTSNSNSCNFPRNQLQLESNCRDFKSNSKLDPTLIPTLQLTPTLAPSGSRLSSTMILRSLLTYCNLHFFNQDQFWTPSIVICLCVCVRERERVCVFVSITSYSVQQLIIHSSCKQHIWTKDSLVMQKGTYYMDLLRILSIKSGEKAECRTLDKVLLQCTCVFTIWCYMLIYCKQPGKFHHLTSLLL